MANFKKGLNMNEYIVIRDKNDIFRKTFIGGKVLITKGVQYSPHLEALIKAIKEFDDFNKSNDPYGEHDFGKVTIDGNSWFWKIDYYDDNYEFFKEDGNRVLTIMHVSEY